MRSLEKEKFVDFTPGFFCTQGTEYKYYRVW